MEEYSLNEVFEWDHQGKPLDGGPGIDFRAKAKNQPWLRCQVLGPRANLRSMTIIARVPRNADEIIIGARAIPPAIVAATVTRWDLAEWSEWIVESVRDFVASEKAKARSSEDGVGLEEQPKEPQHIPGDFARTLDDTSNVDDRVTQGIHEGSVAHIGPQTNDA
jgi:hypothetical protein